MKTLLSGLLLAATLTGLGVPANAEDITVRGAPACRAYLAAKEQSKHGDSGEAMSDLVWFLGYMSGLAMGTHINVLKNGDNAESVIWWLDLYCGRYPDRYLSDAGNLFYDYLKETNGKRT